MNDLVKKSSDEKFCADCGAVIKAKAEICPKCGVRQNGAMSFGGVAPNGKNKIAAAMFAFFFGAFGAHKFYLGETGAGVLYLVFFWTFIPSILALVAFISLLTMSDEAFAVKYGNS